jgi:class 3 adenylate cyclase
VSPRATGAIYCATIDACAGLSDFGRASEWTEAARSWCRRKSVGGFPGVCRVHRAEIVRLRGMLGEALDEATRAAGELAEFGALNIVADAHYEIGEIRLRMGDLEGASAAFVQAHGLGRDPEPGRGLLLHAQGKPEAAAASLARGLAERHDRLARTRLLPAAIETAVAAGDLAAARAWVDELSGSAQTFGSPALEGAVRASGGILRLAEGRADEAVSLLREGIRIWAPLDLPYEVARARMALARAYRSLGDEEAARLEIDAARSAFARIGAALDEDRAAAALAEGPSAAAPERARRTFMFTDIVMSTNLVEAIGDAAWADLIRWHDESLRSCFAEHEGEEIKHTGDGFHVAFVSAGSAIACAVGIQRRLAAHRRAHGFAPSVRIGLHAAEASRQDGDWHGVGVHEAARIAALAGGGEIVLSLRTADGVALPAPLADERTVSLRGIAEPVRVARIQWS